jgi:hypothetical protein
VATVRSPGTPAHNGRAFTELCDLRARGPAWRPEPPGTCNSAHTCGTHGVTPAAKTLVVLRWWGRESTTSRWAFMAGRIVNRRWDGRPSRPCRRSSARIRSGSRPGTQPVGRRGPRSGRTATGLSPRLRIAKLLLPGLVVGDHRGDRLGQDRTFALEARGDAQDLLSGVEADIVGRHARSSSPCVARWASWLSGKSTARYPTAVRYQGRRVPRADCSNGQSCRLVIAPSGGAGGAAQAHARPGVRAEPSTPGHACHRWPSDPSVSRRP